MSEQIPVIKAELLRTPREYRLPIRRRARAQPMLWGLLTLLIGLCLPHASEAQAPEGESRAQAAQASTTGPWESFDEVRLTLSAGLIQPLLLRGGNVELDLFYRRLVIGYSHGFLLKLEGNTASQYRRS